MAYDELNDTTGTIMSPKQKEWLIASANCNYEVCMKLLRANPSLANYQSPIDGNTALHLAAKAGSREIIRMLAGDFKADVNAQNHAGLTPLHYAATNANENTLFLLYSTYKADISIRDLFGRRISAMFPETPEGKRLKCKLSEHYNLMHRVNEASSQLDPFYNLILPVDFLNSMMIKCSTKHSQKAFTLGRKGFKFAALAAAAASQDLPSVGSSSIKRSESARRGSGTFAVPVKKPSRKLMTAEARRTIGDLEEILTQQPITPLRSTSSTRRQNSLERNNPIASLLGLHQHMDANNNPVFTISRYASHSHSLIKRKHSFANCSSSNGKD